MKAFIAAQLSSYTDEVNAVFENARREPRSLTISRKGRDMDEYFESTLRWGDESEASIVIPFGERAFDAHHLHCFSQGTPSASPSIFTFEQCCKKNSASAQEVISEQRVRPSQ
jgi:hypothetical protein